MHTTLMTKTGTEENPPPSTIDGRARGARDVLARHRVADR